MTVSLAVATATSNTGTTDLTSSGFGTPDAAMLITTFSDAAAGSLDSQLSFSVGFTDGTNQAVSAVSSRNGQSSSTAKRRQATDECIMRLAPNTGNIRAEAHFDSWVTDGIRVDWSDDDDSLAKHHMAILFGSDHADAAFVAGQVSPTSGNGSATNVTTLGDEADFVILSSIQRSTADTTEANACMSLGIWINDGSDTQHSVNWFDLDAKSTTEAQTFLDTSYALGTLIVTSEGAGMDISGHASGFTVTVRERNSHSSGITFNYLAGKWGDVVKQAVGTYDVPTSTGTDATTGVGFSPEHLISLMSFASAADSYLTDNTASSMGVGYSDGTNEECLSVSVEDGVTTTDTDSLYNTALFSAREGGSNSIQTGTVDSFDSDGFTVDWTSAPISTAGNAVFWAIREVTVGEVAIDAEAAMTVAGLVTKLGAATAAAEAVMTAAGTVTRLGVASMSAESSMTVSGVVTRYGEAAMEAESAMTAAGLRSVTAAASMEAESLMTVGGLATRYGAATLEAEALMIVQVAEAKTGEVTFSAESLMTVSGQRFPYRSAPARKVLTAPRAERTVLTAAHAREGGPVLTVPGAERTVLHA